jgi:hypothetical protein
VRQSGTRLPSAIADALEPWWEVRVADARTAKGRAMRTGPSSRRTIVRAGQPQEDEE